MAVSGAVKSAQSMPFPFNIAAIATGIATVMANIRTARGLLSKADVDSAVDNVTPNVSSSTSSKTPIQGLGNLIPNVQGIDANTFGGTQPVQAYVVENDISNAQSLQEELDIQATL